MSARKRTAKLEISFFMVLVTIAILHALLLASKGLPQFDLAFFRPEKPTVLQIRQVKTPRVEHSQIKTKNSIIDPVPEKAPPSLRDLSELNPSKLAESPKTQRPGSIPLPKKSALSSLSIKDKKFSHDKGISVANLSQGANKVQDAIVSIEVPDGVEPDELNQYELMFYGFQKRTAIVFANSIMSNLDKFNKKYPRYKLPQNSTITMTARMTYDEKGNVKQIKMIRWTHMNELQDFFQDVVQNMDQLHNPPKALWETNGEFSMFFTLEIING